MSRIPLVAKVADSARIALAVVLVVLLTAGATAASASHSPTFHAPRDDVHLSEPIGTGSTSALASASSSVPAGLTSWVVNTTDDTDDGACDPTHCSLLEALNAAADQQGAHVITFSIPTWDPGYDPSTGVWTIQPASGLNVPLDTTVDGSVSSAPDARVCSVRPGIEIDGTTLALQGYTGLRVPDNVTLRGLVINHFQYGVWIAGDNVTIEGCYIGTDPTGTQAKPNVMAGILVANGASNAVIEHNLLSGNLGPAIRLFGESTTGNIVRNNCIGTSLDRNTPLPNGSHGTYFHLGAHDNSVGPDNLIAFNGAPGVWVDGQGTRGNTITRNQVYGNSLKGILLSDGGNDGLAPPVIASSSPTQVSGTACPGCTIEIFSDAQDQGALYEGNTIAGPGGNWVFTTQARLRGPYLTATATDGHGNTSEFSATGSLLCHDLWLPLVVRGN